ncbi:hypothetical protein Gasu2_48690 [Galdieria sulphuraria]|uniref:Uncharacterized protein n=1 Tax=Galdieria sulphuraria TaxID=130081 RepID=M2WXB5_GALSU|nr:uncharacterized protein Gasu_38830 [Galdieria sulphuraria]EME28675.1 hypothetical protein Gasu_38830 [Galdieria sulphuraria]GJD10692.1 hypothetical protein Gasu2_48690 [Galdieria sulphuraria]|eukprot:XP_005705195.1 hypothetical protein Gasu_38830 [Galdieria sulphuraria]
MVNAWVGAAIGLAAQIVTNGARLLPLSRRPWEHLAAMGLGAYIGKIWGEYQRDKIERKEYRLRRELENTRRENRMRLQQEEGLQNGATHSP